MRLCGNITRGLELARGLLAWWNKKPREEQSDETEQQETLGIIKEQEQQVQQEVMSCPFSPVNASSDVGH